MIFLLLMFSYLTTCFLFFFNDTATTEIYTLSLHDALPISEELVAGGLPRTKVVLRRNGVEVPAQHHFRSEEHTSELQSPDHLVCRLLLEKKKNGNFWSSSKGVRTGCGSARQPGYVLGSGRS